MSSSSIFKNNRCHFLKGGGEMSALTRSFNWENTSLGPSEFWPVNLKTTLNLLLQTEIPMLLWWGEEMLQFYNDDFKERLKASDKHPKALGQSGPDSWQESWNSIYKAIKQVTETGEALNFNENNFFGSFRFTPIIGDLDTIDGVLAVGDKAQYQENFPEDMKVNDPVISKQILDLNDIILQAPVAMCIFRGADLVVEIANNLMLRFWGKNEIDILGKPVFEGIHEARNQGFEAILEEVYQTGKTYSAQAVPVNLSRSGVICTVYVNFIYQAILDASGKVTGIIAVAVDVTEQVRAAKEMQKAEQEIRSLMESAPFPIGVYRGKEMRLHLLNQSIIETWGKGPDILGKTFEEALPELKEERFVQQLQEVYQSGKAIHGRNERVDFEINGNMQKFYFNYSYTPLFDENGEVYGVMNTGADVTDLNEAKQKVELSENNFKSMILQSPVPMCILHGPEHKVDIANKAILELWDKSADEVLQVPVCEAMKESSGEEFKVILDNVFNLGTPYNAKDHLVMMKRKGIVEEVFQDIVFTPYRDPADKIIGVMAVVIDVSQQVIARKKIEEVVAARTKELEVANKDLKKSNADLAQFAYIASHDLQEPIRKIRIFSQMIEKMLEDYPNEQAKIYLEKIETSSARMHALIKDVLTFSEVSNKSSEIKAVDLNELIQQILCDFELVIAEKEAEIEVESLPTLNANPLQMYQLFGNLISNALKFVRKDLKPLIRIAVRKMKVEEIESLHLRSDLTYCNISVQDNGIGFRQEHAEQIFNIFQRLHKKADYEGTGIGLALCRKIARNHQGDLFAEGNADKGAVFNIIIPVNLHALPQMENHRIL
jgi:PAS domain S-box-containing protein